MIATARNRALPMALAVFASVSSATLSLGAQELVLHGARILAADGSKFRLDLSIWLRNGRIHKIAAAGELGAPPSAPGISLDGMFLVPGLIDLHSHLLLHPYDETPWNDQVLKESLELRTIRGTVAAKATLEAGFTTLREMGTEGAAFADVALRDAVRQGLIPGPRILAATRALVATGCYGPSGFDPRWQMPKGAQEADGVDGVQKAVRQQIAAGADWIKVYADYRRRPGDPSTPTYSQGELDAIVAEAQSAGLLVAAHAVTDEATRRAVQAGVRTIEHGYQISAKTLESMREKGVILCPTLAANEAIVRYRGSARDNPVLARRLNVARITFKRALAAGVTIACGSDVGVFRHGDNAREIELMAEYGMTPVQALRAATSVAAAVIDKGEELGRVQVGYLADLLVVAADPLVDPRALREVRLVVKAGRVVVDRRPR